MHWIFLGHFLPIFFAAQLFTVGNCLDPLQTDIGKDILKNNDYRSVDMIRACNLFISRGYSEEEIVGILKFAIAEERIEIDDLVHLVPVLFPEELQDATTVPSNCDFAQIVDGRFAWKFPFRRIIVFRDFPVECLGHVGNAGYRGDGADLFRWLTHCAKRRPYLIEPPSDLVEWSNIFLNSREFTHLLNDLNLSAEADRTRSIVRSAILDALDFLPSAADIRSKNFEFEITDTEWYEFANKSATSRKYVFWNGNEYVLKR